jgi:hypothetical protein
MLKQDEISKKHEDEIQVVFKALKQLIKQDQEPREAIGFKRKGE